MKKRVLSILLSIAMVISLLPASAAALTRASDRVWDLTAASPVERPTLQGGTGAFDGIQIDATAGKFAPRDADTQINAGTVLSIPVEANEAGGTLTLTLSGGSASVEADGITYESSGNTIQIPIQPQAENVYCSVSFLTQGYLSALAVAYNQPQEEYPGQPQEVPLQDTVWDLAAGPDLLPTVQSDRGAFEGLLIDAQNGKFAPRASDTQINAGTVLHVPVAANENGGTLTLTLSGGSASVEADGITYESSGNTIQIPIQPQAENVYCSVSFLSQGYLSALFMAYNQSQEEYPGQPQEVPLQDTVWDLAAGPDLLPTVQSDRGAFEGLLIDAQNGKFAPRASDTQINSGTVLYLPLAADPKGVVLTVSGTPNGQTLLLDGAAISCNQKITLAPRTEAAYLKLEVTGGGSCYLTALSLNYGSDSDFAPPVVEAVDKQWDLTGQSTVTRPEVQGDLSAFDGVQIDASAGKFAPRDGDTQITGGTILYLPIAPDSMGATLTVMGNNYNNLSLTLEGQPISVGVESLLPAVEEPTYLALSFEGEGSCYLTGISVNYLSYTVEPEKTVVTVGQTPGYDFSSIQSALDACSSSEARPLVLLIAPGTYTEKITVDKPWVTFQPLLPLGAPVILEESYYSSNTFDADGVFIPQDEFDVGTDQCGTVTLTANATGFRAQGITFQNSYNITDHIQAGEQTPAVAFHSKADKVYLKDCTFLGRQDTLYLQGAGSRVRVEDCYIEGTVDFIFGDAEAYFTGCTLHMAPFAGRNTGYYTAPNTKAGYVGFVFAQCTLTADPSYAAGSASVYLGRPWQNECYNLTKRGEDGVSFVVEYDPDRPQPSYQNVSSAASFLDCSMDSILKDSRWMVWTRKDQNGKTLDVTYHPTVRFAEYNSRDLDGLLLEIPDEITLGSMDQSADTAALIAGLTDRMGFGMWTPTPSDVTPAVYTVTFDPCGGTVPENTLSTNWDGTLSALPTPSYSASYRFDGWFTAAEGGEAVANGAVFTADTTLYAHWTYLGGSGATSTYYTITASVDGEGEGTISPEGRVRVYRGNDRTFTITPAEGSFLDQVLVDGEDVGPVTSYTFENVRENHTIQVSFAVEIEEPDVPLGDLPFVDVPTSAWYAPAVAYVKANGMMNGTSALTFAPEDPFSRAMMAQVLYNMAGTPAVDGTPSFADLAENAWYTDAVAWASENGLMTGYGPTAFGPDDSLTREQLATVLWRSEGSPEMDSDALDRFADGSAASGWARQALCWAVSEGILAGKGSGLLDPTGTATRAEVAQMLYNASK